MGRTSNTPYCGAVSPRPTRYHPETQQGKFISHRAATRACPYWSLPGAAQSLESFHYFLQEEMLSVRTRVGVCRERNGWARRGLDQEATGGAVQSPHSDRAVLREGCHDEAPARVSRCSHRGVSNLFSTVSPRASRLAPHNGGWFRGECRRCLSFAFTVFVLLAFVYQPTLGSGTQGSWARDSSTEGLTLSVAKRREVLFAGPLHGDAVGFVAARVNSALSAGASLSQASTVAAEAAFEISWGDCSRLCNGGTQTADRDGARTLAMEGFRRALSGREELSNADVQATGELAANIGLDGEGTKGQVTVRPCNTFRCPPEVPTDLKAALLQLARDPASLLSLGVVPQVGFSKACTDQMKLDQITQEDWTKRRKQHLERLQKQQSQGEEQGWEVTLLASSRLSLYGCVSLCRLYRRCGAVIYADGVGAMKTSGDKNASSAADASETALADPSSAVPAVDDSFEVQEFYSLLGSAVPPESPDRGPVCTLYGRLKVTHVSECAVEPTEGDIESLTFLVLNPNLDFAEAAHSMRMTMALERERRENATFLATGKTSHTQTASDHQQRASGLASKISKSGRTLKSMKILSQAVKVMDGAAFQAASSLKAAQFSTTLTGLLSLTSRLPSGKEESGRVPVEDLYSLHAVLPLSDSCPMFAGVELLGRGCVQLPPLRIVSTFAKSPSSDANASKSASKPAKPEEVVSMTWRRCRGLLGESEQLLTQYRHAVSQMKGKGAGSQEASVEAVRLVPMLLGLDSVQAAKLSLSESITDLPKDNAFVSKDDEAFLEKMDALRSRRDVVKQLGEGNGSIFAVFDTMREACEIRAIFEPRVGRGSDSLGAQFPSACGRLQPSSMLLLPSVTESSGTRDTTGGDVDKTSQEAGICPEISCFFSSWTSWSPCDNPEGPTADVAGEAAQTDEERHERDASSKQQHLPATWQVRFKETLLQPRAVPRCETLVQARLCKNRMTADREATSQMDGFANAIARITSTWCEYSPFSAWTQCEPQCIPADSQGTHAYRTRTRYVHQYPVPGLAPSCDLQSLEVHEVCQAVPKCQNEEAEGRDLKTVTTDDGSAEAAVVAASAPAAAAIHLHTRAAAADRDTKAKRRVPRANRNSQAALPGSSGPASSFVGRQGSGRDSPDPPTTMTQEDLRRSVAENNTNPHSVTFFDTTGQEPGKSFSHPEGYSSFQSLPVKPSDVRELAGAQGSSETKEPTRSAYDTIRDLEDSQPSTIPILGHNKIQNSDAPQGNFSTLPSDPPAFAGIESGDATHNGQSSLPYDSPTSGDTDSGGVSNTPKEDTGGGEASVKEGAGSQAPEPETFLFGLTLASFLACCLCGAFACATLVLLLVVCSAATRSWLGHDWSAATQEERKALLEKKGGLAASSAAAPLVDPNGVRVMTPQGAPLLVSPCMGTSGVQHVTAGGSKIFVTMDGDFVDNWGKPIQASELPEELQAQVGGTPGKGPVVPVSLPLHLPPQPSTPKASSPQISAAPSPGPASDRAPIAKAVGLAGGHTIVSSRASALSPAVPQTKEGTLRSGAATKQAAPVMPQAKVGAASPGPPFAKSAAPGLPTPKTPKGL